MRSRAWPKASRGRPPNCTRTSRGFVGGIHNIQKAFQLIGEVAMLGFVGEQIMDLGKEFAEFGEQTAQAAQKTGQSTDAIQELNFAANQNAVSSQAMQMSMQRLSRSMAEVQQGSEQAAGAFKSVGLSADELKNMSLDEVLNKVADAFRRTPMARTKRRSRNNCSGRGAAQLIPVLNQGSSGIAQLREEAQQLGVVMSEAGRRGRREIEQAVRRHGCGDVGSEVARRLRTRAGDGADRHGDERRFPEGWRARPDVCRTRRGHEERRHGWNCVWRLPSRKLPSLVGDDGACGESGRSR